MANVIRLSISDRDILNSLTEKDIGTISKEAMDLLVGSDVRGFIYSCFTNQEEKKGLIMVDEVISYAEENTRFREDEASTEIVEAALGTLSILSESMPILKTKVFEVLEHKNPSIVAVAVNSLGHSSNLENFKKVCNLLLREEYEVNNSAAKYVEACARDAAFRNRRDKHAIEDVSEDFLRRALVPLENAYEQLKKRPKTKSNVEKRTALLIAMIYNEILNSTDWKRTNSEEIEERIYCALEYHLSDRIGPEALPFLCKMLERPEIEEGIKRSALKTVGRLSKEDNYIEKITFWLEEYMAIEKSEELLKLAKNILDSCESGRTYSSVPPKPRLEERSSIIPKSAGAPPKIRK
ncbi:MAG: hypothetical protein GY847_34160 [Proteobacteria bacterium]|nr:hypothetical protein [Pseudomonadota bacterium]